MQYSNGDAYEGSWVKDCRHGSAKYFYANGDVFVGKFDNNRREGLSTIYMVSSISYICSFLCYTVNSLIACLKRLKLLAFKACPKA